MKVKHRKTLLACTILAMLLGGAWVLSIMPPTWFAPIAADNDAAATASERIEFGVQQALHTIRPDGTEWTLRIPDDVANAWLATRLLTWLRGHGVSWPEGVGRPQVHFRDGHVVVAARIAAMGDRVCSIRLLPFFNDGMVHEVPVSAAIGMLPIPFSPTTVLGDDLDDMIRAAKLNTTIQLVDHREVQIIALRPLPGQLEVDLRTVE
ncbi:MAG: hypothetical protein MK074_02905 [Phycisphaerales bacterium]|nr:hypothetical protein [Phycisphaerales bacterium]